MKKKIETLIFGGGGIRGISYIGGLRYLEEQVVSQNLDLNVTQVCGVSVGCIFALFFVLGLDSFEMETEIMEKNLEKLKKLSYMNFWGGWGLDTGENIILWMESVLLKSVSMNRGMTFSDLWKLKPVKINVLAGNLNRYTFQPFNNIDTPDFPVLDAIRMSIGIPLVFTKKLYNGDIMLDGGIISSYPLSLYCDKLETTLGFKSVNTGEHNETVYQDINSLESFLYNLFSCFTVQRDKYINMTLEMDKHTVFILSTKDSEVLKFKLDQKEKKDMITMGYNITKETFEKYYVKEKIEGEN